jgi:hypothetical protein
MTDLAPGVIARIGGGLYLVNIVLGAFAIGFVPGAAGNVHANELLFRSGIAAHVAVTVTNVPLALIFYELFHVVDRRAALLVVFFTLVATAVEASALIVQLTSLSFVGAGAAYTISTFFFGFYALAIGYLIYRSAFLPRAIGTLMAIDGLAYLTNSLATILAPGFAAHLVPYIQLPTLAGEGSLMLWLMLGRFDAARRERLEVAV